MERAPSKMRALKTADESLTYKYLEPRCRTCKKPLMVFETRINQMREEGISDEEIFKELDIRRTCCRNAISNPIPMSLAEYIGPEVELHKVLEEPVKKLSIPTLQKEKEQPRVQADVAQKRVSELMGLAKNLSKTQKEERKEGVQDGKPSQKTPTRLLYAV